MYKTYLQAEKDPYINNSFYYDTNLAIDTIVFHNNLVCKVIHTRNVSEIYSSEEIKKEFIDVLNKTYHNCTDSEMDYIIYSLDKKIIQSSEELNKEESSNRFSYEEGLQ